MEESAENRYEIQALLGRGGFGTVYRAQYSGEGGFSKPVAIKILNPEMNGVEEIAKRLRDEARMLGKLDHRAIVRVDKLIRIDGRWAVIMEYVHGIDLRDLIAGVGRIPPAHALEIIAEVASALHAACDGDGQGPPLGLVHRDVKPENIFLTGSGAVKILDFGIARAEFSEREAFTSDVRFGSPHYMAPERFDQSVDEPDRSSTDIYSLGVVLYELLLGVPFGRTSPIESRHRKYLLQRMLKLDYIGISDDVADLVRTMLAYEPDERPTAREVEKQALALRAGMEGATALRYWAEEVVPPLIKEGEEPPSDVTRLLLADGTAAYNNSMETLVMGGEAVAQSAITVAGLVAVAVITGSVAGGMYFWLNGQQAPIAPPTPVQVAPAPTAPVPTVAPEPMPEPEPEPEPELAPSPPEPARTAKRKTKRKAKAKAHARPTEDQPHAMVRVAGDANRVVLIGISARYRVPGRVPPGRYSTAADFGGRGLQVGAPITVNDGDQVTIRCDGLLESCAVIR